MPLDNLGLIVADECDHESYDQQDTLPYYHAVATAAAYARLAGAVALFGSAPPRGSPSSSRLPRGTGLTSNCLAESWLTEKPSPATPSG